jgi:ubiquinol-cytochrome c reductase cytochrome b subunit
MSQLPRARRYRRTARAGADAVAVRLTSDQLIRQVLQGGGNMPAYGKNLNPAETTALVAFLETLHPAGQRAAQDASAEARVQAGAQK